MTRGAVMSALAALFLAFAGACGPEPVGGLMAVKSVSSGGRTVTMVECPQCEMCARFSADAKTATMNSSRLRDGDPSEKELESRCARLLDRVFATMEEAASAKGVFWGDELAAAWRANGVAPRVVKSDADGKVLVRDVEAKGATEVRELAIYSAADVPRTFEVELKSLGLVGTVEALDLTERAIPPDIDEKLSVLVPAKCAKIYRLVSRRAAWKDK